MAAIHPGVTGRRSGAAGTLRAEQTLTRRPQDTIAEILPSLSALELERHISVPEAAALKGISPDTFKRHYRAIIRHPSPRRSTVKLRDLLCSEEGNA
jgi:hypothetical protein